MEFEVGIYSPRWGHEDMYRFTLTRDALVIEHGPRSTTCNWRDGQDPEWDGEALEAIMRNDSIYPPSILPRLLEHAWNSWRDGTLDDHAVEIEVCAVVDWINELTRIKPATEFWRAHF